MFGKGREERAADRRRDESESGGELPWPALAAAVSGGGGGWPAAPGTGAPEPGSHPSPAEPPTTQ